MDELTIPKRETGSKLISVRLKPSEHVILEAKARKAGIPLATLIRAAALHLITANVKVN